jgi:hypothetical protein
VEIWWENAPKKKRWGKGAAQKMPVCLLPSSSLHLVLLVRVDDGFWNYFEIEDTVQWRPEVQKSRIIFHQHRVSKR